MDIVKLEGYVCSRSCGCALERIPNDGGCSLFIRAATLGISEAEAYGMMDGWDSLDGKSWFYNVYQDSDRVVNSQEEYWSGFGLGQHLYELAEKAGKV